MHKGLKHIIEKSRVFLISTLLFLFIQQLNAQTPSFRVSYTIIDQSISFPQTTFNTLEECKTASELQLQQWRNEGYFLASIDSAFLNQNNYTNQVFLGPKSEEIILNTSHINNNILKGRYWRGNSNEKSVALKDLPKAKEQLLDYYQNQGYPFTEVKIDSISFDGKNLHGQIKVQLGEEVILDTLIVKREKPIGVHKKFFEAYLGLKKGEIFRQRNVDRAAILLEETPYLKLKKQPDVVFEYGKAMVEIPLEKRRASRADGMIGFAPNGQQEGELLLTGQVMLDLWNPFGTGKRFYIDWKKPDNDSQWFNASYYHPRFLKTSFDIGYDINLQQQDTTFLKVENGVNIRRRVSTRANLAFGVTWNTSRILRELTETDIDTLNDTKSTTYSMSYDWQNLDDPLAPRRGLRYSFLIMGGQRTIIYNPSLPQEVYDGIPEKSILLHWNFEAEYYFGLSKWLEGYLKLNAAQMLGDHLYKNELLRIGGFRSIRGFNEGELFVDRYTYLTFEPRINIGDQSYLFAFTDIGISGFKEEWDAPIGVGAGINISTKSGDFSIAYALGRTNEIPLSTNLAKIHFGFIGKF